MWRCAAQAMLSRRSPGASPRSPAGGEEEGQMNRIHAALVGGLLMALPAWATETAEKPLSHPDRFGFYEDNFMLLNRMRNNGWAGNDDTAVRAHYSLRYICFGRDGWDVFLSYTGEFDFYWGTRPSGPVINRKSNPALHLRWALNREIRPSVVTDYLELGMEHSSDGQTTEVTSAPDAAVAQRAYERLDRPFFDQISRGSNFISLAVHLSEKAERPFFVHAKARLYTHQDSAVTWGPLAGRDVRLSDYNRFTARVGKKLGADSLVDFQWTVGDKGLKTDSFDLGLQFPVFSLPVYLRLHRGPLNTLSNYSQRQDSIGIGLRFNSLIDSPAWPKIP
jgi:outer membrane phospholipase A